MTTEFSKITCKFQKNVGSARRLRVKYCNKFSIENEIGTRI